MKLLGGKALVAIVGGALALAWSAPSHAFCGFYVSGGDASLVNGATLVVMMRKGTKTVLSMQNNYQGPPEDFAMVVPVPVVLQQENVRTLPASLFARVEQLGAPRLVEYWEQDPCGEDDAPSDNKEGGTGTRAKGEEGSMGNPNARYGVKIEAQFVVGEYDIVVLGANDSSGLDAWIRDNGYKIPPGAEPYLRPYVQSGSKFFVAKVDVKKVQFKDGRAMLSPLRFHYDAETFTLPVRLGLLNSGGTQDLIVNILAESRFEAANYPNVTIPTNLDVADEVRSRFPTFYATLYDETVKRHPRAVVTEYAWSAGSCDPCPTPSLQSDEIAILGGDVTGMTQGGWGRGGGGGSIVLTRLHARYEKSALGEDLVFKKASPIGGGREEYLNARRGEDAQVQGAFPDDEDQFQARYVIRHPWQGAVRCTRPQYGEWGGPPGKRGGPDVTPARDLAFAPRTGLALTSTVIGNLEELGLSGVRRPGKPWGVRIKLMMLRYETWLGLGFALGLALVVVLARRARAHVAAGAGKGEAS